MKEKNANMPKYELILSRVRLGLIPSLLNCRVETVPHVNFPVRTWADSLLFCILLHLPLFAFSSHPNSHQALTVSKRKDRARAQVKPTSWLPLSIVLRIGSTMV